VSHFEHTPYRVAIAWRYYTIRDAILTCAQNLTSIYRTEPKTKKQLKKEKLKSNNKYAEKYAYR